MWANIEIGTVPLEQLKLANGINLYINVFFVLRMVFSFLRYLHLTQLGPVLMFTCFFSYLFSFYVIVHARLRHYKLARILKSDLPAFLIARLFRVTFKHTACVGRMGPSFHLCRSLMLANHHLHITFIPFPHNPTLHCSFHQQPTSNDPKRLPHYHRATPPQQRVHNASQRPMFAKRS